MRPTFRPALHLPGRVEKFGRIAIVPLSTAFLNVQIERCDLGCVQLLDPPCTLQGGSKSLDASAVDGPLALQPRECSSAATERACVGNHRACGCSRRGPDGSVGCHSRLKVAGKLGHVWARGDTSCTGCQRGRPPRFRQPWGIRSRARHHALRGKEGAEVA